VSGGTFFCDELEYGFDKALGFGARDESVFSDVEIEAEEFLLAGQMLQRFLRDATDGEGTESDEMFGGKRIVAVGDEPRAVAAKDVRKQGFGIAARDALRGFVNGIVESHTRRQ